MFNKKQLKTYESLARLNTIALDFDTHIKEIGHETILPVSFGLEINNGDLIYFLIAILRSGNIEVLKAREVTTAAPDPQDYKYFARLVALLDKINIKNCINEKTLEDY